MRERKQRGWSERKRRNRTNERERRRAKKKITICHVRIQIMSHHAVLYSEYVTIIKSAKVRLPKKFLHNEI